MKSEIDVPAKMTEVWADVRYPIEMVQDELRSVLPAPRAA